jgi:hypothetical protein
MAWLSTTWRRRQPVTVITTGGGATGDVTITIPPGWDDFWETIDSSGNDLRITASDGQAAISYKLNSWTYASRTGVIQLDNMALPGVTNLGVVAWLYFAPTSTQASGASVFTASTPLTGAIDLAEPVTDRVLAMEEPIFSLDASPRQQVVKSSSASQFVYFDLDYILERSSSPAYGRTFLEEPYALSFTVLDSAGSTVAGMTDPASLRIIQQGRGNKARLFAKCRYLAGTDATRYTGSCRLQTQIPGNTAYRTIETRIGIAIRDSLET